MSAKEEYDRLPLLMREGQLRSFTGLSRRAVRNMRENGQLGTIKIGIQVRYLKTSLFKIVITKETQS